MDKTKNLVELITKGIQDKKGHGIVIADLSEIDGTICRYFVICQGNSTQQVEAIAGSVSDYVRETIGEKPINCVGLGNARGWRLIMRTLSSISLPQRHVLSMI